MLIAERHQSGAPARSDRAPMSDTRLFRVALALVALAVVDDAFLHPEPGTAAADHLISGGVPVAVAIALGLAYPRLRAGARAAAALVCGALAILGGTTDGIRHAVVDRVSGDDASAVLAAPHCSSRALSCCGGRGGRTSARAGGTHAKRW